MSCTTYSAWDSTLEAIENLTNEYPGLFRETQTYLDERIEEVVSGAKTYCQRSQP